MGKRKKLRASVAFPTRFATNEPQSPLLESYSERLMRNLTLRDLFAVVVIVALTLGWWGEHRRLVSARKATVDVTGTVTLDGRPLATGRIDLSRNDGHSVGCEISNGSFKIPGVPVGEWSVGIQGESVPPLYAAGMTTSISQRVREFRYGLKGVDALNNPAAAQRGQAGQ